MKIVQYGPYFSFVFLLLPKDLTIIFIQIDTLSKYILIWSIRYVHALLVTFENCLKRVNTPPQMLTKLITRGKAVRSEESNHILTCYYK